MRFSIEINILYGIKIEKSPLDESSSYIFMYILSTVYNLYSNNFLDTVLTILLSPSFSCCKFIGRRIQRSYFLFF